jgi:hypothetical protein
VTNAERAGNIAPKIPTEESTVVDEESAKNMIRLVPAGKSKTVNDAVELAAGE